MSKIVPPDQSAREKIADVLDKNFLVEAGAGSGKTSSLVKRMLSIIMAGNIEIKEMAAITFTRKAAAELRERFQNQLERKYRETLDPKLKALLEKALLDLDQCFLGTIHSFCARLLRERPVEAGLDPDFKELDDTQNKLLIEKAWESYLLEVKLNKPHLLAKLDEIGVELKDLKSSFIRLSEFPDVKPVYEKVPEPDLTSAFEPLKKLIARAIEAIPHTPPEKGYDDLQKAVRKASRYLDLFNLDHKANKVKIIALFNKEKKVVQNRWNTKDEAKQYRDEFNELFSSVIRTTMTSWLEYCHYHIMEFLVPAVKYFENMRGEHSMLNFQDLLMKTSAMLKNYPEVRAYFQDKYKTLLIDEFQDTDPIQSEIMFYLTGEDIREQNWLKLTPKPGSLFVVGDPKQSIYRFRRADIDIYNVVKDLIVKSGGEILKLTANFRSLKNLGEWFNPTFKKLFPDTYKSYQAEFSSLDTIYNNESDKISGIRLLDIPDAFTKKDEIVQVEAEYIARYIKWALEGNLKLTRSPEEKKEGVSEIPKPKDFMILLRYKDSMDVYARALEKYRIPVSITGGSSLKDAQEIWELLKLLKALNDIENQVALVAVLKGLFFGLSDDELYKFKKAGGYFNIYRPIPEDLSEDIYDKFEFSYETLKKYHGWAKKYSPITTLEKIILDLGLIPYTLTGDMGQSRCSYIYQILEKLREVEIGTAYSFNLLVEQFMVLLEEDFEEELNILAEKENAVRLMNLHKAKGLEAPVVFLAHPYKKVNYPPEEHVKRVNDIPKGYFSFYRSRGFQRDLLAQPKNWQEYCKEESKYIDAEETRLLYVAATRAKNLLIISRSLKDKDMKKNAWSLLVSEALEKEVLEIPKRDQLVIKDKTPSVEVKPEDLKKVEKVIQKEIAAMSKVSYNVTSPTGLKSGECQPQVLRLEGGGMDWGTAIHTVLEQVVKTDKDIDTVITLALKENKQSLDRKVEVLEMIKAFQNSDLWKRIQRAKRVFTEIPFTLKIEPGHELYKLVKGESDVPVILNGVIDLVLEEDDGWKIIDYKTDRPQNKEDFKTLEDMYSFQIKLYCKIWEEITGFKVSDGELYFTTLNENRRVC